MSRINFIIVALIATSLPNAFAQAIITGTVIDSKDSKPIEFAAVSVKGKSIGTITNSVGEFSLHLSKEAGNDTLYISMIGYSPVAMPMSSIAGHLMIKMEEQAVMLDEVQITGTKLTIDDIFKGVRSNLKKNYPVDEYAIECFYREIKKEDGVYKSLLEAALVVTDKGYDHLRSQESAYVHEIRGSNKYINPYSDFWQHDNLWGETIRLNAVRHAENIPSVFGKNTYQLQGVVMYNDREVYVLVSDPIKEFAWQRTMYVDVDTYAIYRSEEKIVDTSVSWRVADNDTISFRMTQGSGVFDFKEYKGKLYANHLRFEAANQYFNTKTGKIYATFTIINDLMVNEVYDHAGAVTSGLKKLENAALDLQLTRYNESFWKNYNAVLQTPLEEEVMKDLMKGGKITFEPK
jgi:hypothetical protein